MNDDLVIEQQSNTLPRLNVFQRIAGAIFSPERLMNDLEQKPRVLLGIILNVLAPVILMYGTFPMFKEYLRTTMEMTAANTAQQMTPELLDQVVNISAISTPIMGGIMAGGMFLIQALVIWLVTKIFKGQASYKQILSVLGYSSVISVLGTIVTVAVIYITGTYTDVTYTSLASLLPEIKGSFIYGVAKVIEVFYIWQLVVNAIGIAIVSKMDKKKAYLIMVLVLIVYAVFTGYSEIKAAALLK